MKFELYNMINKLKSAYEIMEKYESIKTHDLYKYYKLVVHLCENYVYFLSLEPVKPLSFSLSFYILSRLDNFYTILIV